MFVPSATELRQQSFLWADDLSTYDAFINFRSIFRSWAVTSVFLPADDSNEYPEHQIYDAAAGQGANPQMAAMKWMSYLMPVMFLFILNDYPSGLNYYYFISTLVSVVTTIIMRKMTNEEALLAQLEANRKDPKKMKKTGFAARLEAMQKQQEQMMKEKQNRNKLPFKIFSEGSRTMHFARLPFPFSSISVSPKRVIECIPKPIYRICRLNTPTKKSGL